MSPRDSNPYAASDSATTSATGHPNLSLKISMSVAGIVAGLVSGLAFNHGGWAFAPGIVLGIALPLSASLSGCRVSYFAAFAVFLASVLGYSAALRASLHMFAGWPACAASSSIIGSAILASAFAAVTIRRRKLAAVVCTVISATLVGLIWDATTPLCNKYIGPPIAIPWYHPLVFALWQGGAATALGVFTEVDRVHDSAIAT